ncbi:ParB/RepB/Spo0J family partition protein [Ponticaulis sp.]|uniref:ParB/RepB/Spo0J family partition protein n=1 Tax=Ponticaulis sp. TaxID=2020902 RepID=UPI000B6DB964|nr:ParB/RepB/Spo0J family partition protein [Ponticaulis sp.]MAI91012.1 chromosome partitioning protein ParB [Ponticaulis sp.]OUX98350.1 MAG: chromosome partitioning protein ParB [Hyphomonadaceae bacterium TMED5]|tara:strand:+ start:124027 stop:124917 length:891 start_codon:yes stop_codon:yes gene_type:complete
MSEEPKKNSRLGKGLSALIGEYDTFEGADGASDSAKEVQMLRMKRVKPNPNQPRKQFDAKKLEELTASVRVRGVLTPILVREVTADDHDYQIIAGERRFRASKAAGLKEIPARILQTNDVELLEIGLIENIQREDLNAMEEAEGYQALMNRFGKTQEALAEAVGKSRAHVANMLRLMNLPEAVRESLRAGDITAGHARAALAADDPEAVVEQVIARKLSVRDTEALVRRLAAGGDMKSARTESKEKDVDTEALEADLSRALGLIVDIRAKASGGELRIKYRDLEQLDDLCRRLSRG